MARIRTIKPEFWTSEQVMECDPLTRLLFIGLWNFCDDAGRMPLSYKRIKAQIFPSDEVSVDEVRRMIDELSSNDLIYTYVVEEKEYLQVSGWHHQRIDRAQTSKIPSPIDERSSNDRRADSVGREGRGEEGKEDAHASSARATASEAEEDPLKAKCVALRKRVVSLYLDHGSNPSNPVPEMGMCDVWVRQGYDPEIIFAIIEGNVRRGKVGATLNYHERQIREAHEKRAPAPAAPIQEIPERLWEARVAEYRVRPDQWPRGLGKPPDHPECKAPASILAKHGFRSAA